MDSFFDRQLTKGLFLSHIKSVSETHLDVYKRQDFNGTIGTNVSGTSDLAPLDEQAKVLHEWFPNAKTVGIIYSTSEANSVFQVQEMTKRLVAMGSTCLLYTYRCV